MIIHLYCGLILILNGESSSTNTSNNNNSIDTHQLRFDHPNNVKINLLLYIPVLVALALYCLLWNILSHRNLHTQCIYFLSDNHKDDRFAYLLEIKTGIESGSGTTSNAMIKIFGSTGISRAHVLNYPDPDLRLLRYNGEDYFIMTTEKHLGELVFIQLWIDFILIEPKWKCDQIRICDLQTKHWWLFNVKKWLTIDKKNYSCLKVLSSPYSLKKKFKFKFFLPFFNTQHTWNFLTSYSRFYTSSEKLTIIFSQILWICFLTMKICIDPHLKNSDSRKLENVNVGFIRSVTFQSSGLTYLINLPFILVFRLSSLTRRELYVHEPNVLSKKFRILLGIGIVGNILTVFMFSLYISFETSLIIYGLILISILWIIFVWEFLFITLTKIFTFRRKDTKRWYFYNRIISEGEQQRAMISRMFEDVSNLRPYLLHLYKPLGVDIITIKRCLLSRITTIENSFRYLLFLITCIFLLHSIITSNRDNLIQIHNEHLKSLIIGESPIKHDTNLLNITTLEGFENYINDILIKTLKLESWYGEHKVFDNRLLTDCQTKYIGTPTIRIITVKAKNPFDLSKKLGNTTKIYREYTNSLENTNNLNRSDSFYYTPVDTKRNTYIGEINTYPGGGFMTFLNVNETNKTLIKENGKEWWMETFTRAIFIEFFTYNNNVNLFSDVMIIVERSPTGLTISSISIISNRLNYRNVNNVLLMKISVYSLIGIVLIYVIITIRNMILTKTICNRLKLLDFFIISATIGALVFYEIQIYDSEKILLEINQDLSKNIDGFEIFYSMENYRNLMSFLIWILIFGIIFYLKFVTIDVVRKLVFSSKFYIYLKIHLLFRLFATVFSLTSYILYGNSKNFHSFYQTFKNILILKHLRGMNTYEIMGYSKTLPYYTYIYALCLLILFSLYICYFLIYYIKEKQRAKFWKCHNYSTWDYLMDKTFFYGKYTSSRLKKIRLAGGGSSICKRIYFRANSHRFCSTFLIRETRIEAIRFIVFGYLYVKYLKENRPLNHVDVTVMLGITESYMKRNDSIEIVYYKDCRRGKKHVISDRRMAVMEIVVDRMLQFKENEENIEERENSWNDFDENLTDIRTLKRLDDLLFHLDVLNQTLEELLDYDYQSLL